MTKYVGVLTSGGDTPGLNAALRGLGKAALETYGMHVIGFNDGFRGVMENRTTRLDGAALSGILTIGGTILGTSRDKPHKMPVGGKLMDMTDAMVEVYNKHHLDVLVCLGGGGTAKSAYRLMQKGLNIITLPKTIDNDIAGTDVTFGFDTALGIATEAIDRLHSTAHSHHRIVVCEIMGHNAGWLGLGAGIAGGADVILIPEIPYSAESVAEAILKRNRMGKRFSIVAVSEGAMPVDEAAAFAKVRKQIAEAENEGGKDGKKNGKKDVKELEARLLALETAHIGSTMRLAARLGELTGLESRVTILGYLQRGGTPSAADRLLATRLGTGAARMINEGKYGFMLAVHGDRIEPVPLDQVVGRRRVIPLDHPWIDSARSVGTALGD
jgi:6-phosphofructokinase 1